VGQIVGTYADDVPGRAQGEYEPPVRPEWLAGLRIREASGYSQQGGEHVVGWHRRVPAGPGHEIAGVVLHDDLRHISVLG
jgi:hypothetical protein